MIISQTSVAPKQMPPCQTLQVLSISWMLLAQCWRKRLVKWSFWSQKLRGSVQNTGHLIRAPARNCGRPGASERTGESVEQGEGGIYSIHFSFLQTWFGFGFGDKTWKPPSGFRLRRSCGENVASQGFIRRDLPITLDVFPGGAAQLNIWQWTHQGFLNWPVLGFNLTGT